MSSKPPSCLIILTGLPKSNKSLVAKDLRRLLDAGEEMRPRGRTFFEFETK